MYHLNSMLNLDLLIQMELGILRRLVLLVGFTAITSFAFAPAALAKRCLKVSESAAANSSWDECRQVGNDIHGKPLFYCCTH